MGVYAWSAKQQLQKPHQRDLVEKHGAVADGGECEARS